MQKRIHHPLTRRAIDLSKTPSARFRLDLHDQIRRLRKTALRLGHLDETSAAWQMKSGLLKKLLSGQLTFHDIGEDDVVYYARQKAVDMKIGLDVASLAYKRLVDQIVLIAGDSDFVPAAKLARREGIDFVLDPLWHHTRPDLLEHVDGLRSIAPKPGVGAEQAQVVSG